MKKNRLSSIVFILVITATIATAVWASVQPTIQPDTTPAQHTPSVKWVGFLVFVEQSVDAQGQQVREIMTNDHVAIGLRDDGVVIWRNTQPLPAAAYKKN